MAEPGRPGSQAKVKARRCEAAKYRHDLTDLRQEPSDRGVVPLVGKGHPGPQPPSAGQARTHAHGRALGRGDGRGLNLKIRAENADVQGNCRLGGR
ncbi:MAG: hypothetical protein PHQ34_07530 [Methanothrix sp.]|nr:hypothetical protein [Methanothrix sp.]